MRRYEDNTRVGSDAEGGRDDTIGERERVYEEHADVGAQREKLIECLVLSEHEMTIQSMRQPVGGANVGCVALARKGGREKLEGEWERM